MTGKISRPTQYIKDNLFIKCIQCTNDKVEMKEDREVWNDGDYHICEGCKARYTPQHVLGLKLIELEKRVEKLENNLTDNHFGDY